MKEHPMIFSIFMQLLHLSIQFLMVVMALVLLMVKQDQAKHLPSVVIYHQQKLIIHMKSMLKQHVIYFIVYHYHNIVHRWKSL
jgi:hypothetical protein